MLIQFIKTNLPNMPTLSKQFNKCQQQWTSYLSTRMPAWNTYLPGLVSCFSSFRIQLKKKGLIQIHEGQNKLRMLLNSKNNHKPDRIVKTLIFQHRLIIEKVEDSMQDVEYIPESQSEGNAQLRLLDQLIKKYFFYLQKRSAFSQMHKSKQNQECQISNIFQILNLIKNGLTLSGQLKSLMRYFAQDYGFSYDLNIGFAADFKELYMQIRVLLTTFIKQLQEGENPHLKQQIPQILKEIQKINDQLRFIYYNHYHQISLKKYIPDFIDCSTYPDQINPTQTSQVNESIPILMEDWKDDYFEILNCSIQERDRLKHRYKIDLSTDIE